MHRTPQGRIVGGCRLPAMHSLMHAPKLKSFMAATIPDTPAIVDWSAKAIQVIEDIEGNDKYGDCCIAEDAHYIAVQTGNANTLYAYTEQQTLSDYSAITGFNPNDPNTDNGTDPVANMNYRVLHGYADGSKDVGWALVDAANPAEVRYALADMGNLKMWFGIPTAIVNNEPNVSGFVWDVSAGDANPQNGHCIGSCGYNPSAILAQPVAATAQGLLVMTWGMLGIITWAAVAKWFVPAAGGGMAVRVNADWINRQSGKSPAGLDMPGMIEAFNTYFGGNLPVPAPTPPPGPAPTSPPTLAAAQAAIDAAFQAAPQDDSVMTKATAAGIAKRALSPLWPYTMGRRRS